MPKSRKQILMSPNGTRILLIACLVGLALMMVLHFKSPVTTFLAESQSSKDRSVPDKNSLLSSQANYAHLVQDIGKGPLSYVREKGHTHNLAKLDIDLLKSDEIVMTVHSYVDNTNVLCGRRIRMGKIGDGGWEICDDPDVRPREPCIIYSFGINNDFSFDDDVARLYGCHVYSFDPSMTKEKDQFDRSSNVHFWKIGLDGKTYVNDKKWSMLTFLDIRKQLGHLNSTVDVVKMDIEDSEWDVIPEMFESGQLYSINQLLIEFHINKEERDYLLPKLKAIQAIERSGFKKFYSHKNHACKKVVPDFPVIRTSCYEIHYMRR